MNLTMRWRILITLGALALAIFILWPTLQYYGLSDEQLANMDPAKAAAMKSGALRLGLDLQGGMHVVLELDDSEIGKDVDRGDLMDRALEIIRNRIDQFGVSEPVVQRAGNKRIIVELAGIDDIDEVNNLISRAAVLEFQMVRPAGEVRRLVEKMDRTLARFAGVAAAADTAGAADSAQVVDAAADSGGTSATLKDYLREDVANLSGRPLGSRITYTSRRGRVATNEVCYVRETDQARVDSLLAYLENSTSAIPSDVEFLWQADPSTDGAGNQIRYLYLLNKSPELTGAMLENASAQPDSRSQGNFQVAFDLDRQGRRKFSRTTGENVGQLMAIVLDGRVKSAPEIESKIRGGSATITGAFTAQEAANLAIVLRAGALPVPIVTEELRAVGPSLGADSITLGSRAIVFGFVGVLIFMVVYYRAAGIIASVALLMNLVLMLGSLVLLDAVLTLPGIAGFVLTVGMAVDANVLIFERVREELRAGQTFRNAISRGYDRAFTTIFDANLTTLFAALALWWFGTGPIKGFAVVLSIGIIISMFTALFVTRLMFDLLTRGTSVRKIPV
jgi:protein-export membrane protein SecD